MKEFIYILQIIFLVGANAQGADYFASVTQLEEMFHEEVRYLNEFEQFIVKLEQNLDAMKRKTYDLMNSRRNVTNVSSFMENPINAFKYIKSVAEYYPYIHEIFHPIYEYFTQIEKNGYLVTEADMDGAANAILRLQSTYSLNTNQLAKGRIHDSQTANLSVDDCIEIGFAACNKNNYDQCNEWVMKAYEMCHSSETLCDETLKISTAEVAAYTNYLNNNFNKSLELTNVVLQYKPNFERAIANKKYLLEEINDTPMKDRSGEFMTNNEGLYDVNKFYSYICRGGIRPTKIMLSSLKCNYVHYNNPYLRIGPIKEEEVHLEPRIVIIKEIIFENEIEEIKNISKILLERSKTQDGVSEVRVSKVAWLYRHHGDVVKKLEERFSIYSDLSILSAEALQVVNYGLGGHYLSHYDAFPEDSAKQTWGSKGNRISTLLVYMNDVIEGGNTVFLNLGLSIKPELGSAALWYNLNNDGSISSESLHAACPVLLGTKWSINVWYHEGHNEFSKPCLPNGK